MVGQRSTGGLHASKEAFKLHFEKQGWRVAFFGGNPSGETSKWCAADCLKDQIAGRHVGVSVSLAGPLPQRKFSTIIKSKAAV
jgi:hypothetical protein